MLVAGECTTEQAEQWIGSHIDLQAERQVLLDTFASMVDLWRDGNGNLMPSSVFAVMGELAPPNQPDGSRPTQAQSFAWWCLAEARMRYAKASAMMEARCL